MIIKKSLFQPFLLLLVLACKPHQKPPVSSRLPEPIIPFNPKQYICYMSGQPLRIDGRLNETAWQSAVWTEDFTDIEGPSKAVPEYRTRAKMLWDEHYFYIGAELEEPHVWATLKEHDSIIFHDNDFEVFIDPDGDSHEYYELEVNAYGTAWDLFLPKPYRDGGGALFYWDIRGLKVGVAIAGSINKASDRDKGWTVEIALPWDVLQERAPGGRRPEPGDQWRVNFSRVEWQVDIKAGKYIKRTETKTGKPLPEDNWVWSPQGVINMHYPEMWGFVQFSAGKAGEGADVFRMRPEEAVKWELRKIYYKQQAYFDAFGEFAATFGSLELKIPFLEGFRFREDFRASETNFEAVCYETAGERIWSIMREGRIRGFDPEN